MDMVFWILFAADSAVHLGACAASKPRLGRFSKVLLMPLLLLVYAFSAGSFLWPVAAAVFFGWLGDIFMMYRDDRHLLAAGMGAFGIGHVFYFFAIFLQFSPAPPLWALVAVPILFLGIAVGAFAFMFRDIPENLRRLSFLYIFLLSSVGAFAVIALLSGVPGSLPLTAGALLFLVSDSVLSLEIFRLGDSAALDFSVMLTYIAAQALIVFAFL